MEIPVETHQSSIRSIVGGVLLVGVLMVSPTLFGAPSITAVMNAASNLSPVLPNASIAPGSIFIIKGSGLGPANIVISDKPFQTTSVGGTSVKVSVLGTTVDALMYYASDKQIAALLPSNTPVGGNGGITVTYNGQNSPATQFRGTVANNFGLFTVGSDGYGPGIVTYADYSLVSALKAANCAGPTTACGAANPGDTLILWGTGLGAIGGSDASGAGLGVNMTNVPARVIVGNVEAPITYKGRSGCCIGEDQIVFTIPANAPTGCGVPLVVQINNQVSNNATIPIASSGRNCDVGTSIAGVTADQVLQVASSSPLTIGDLSITKDLDQNGKPVDLAHLDLLKFRLIPALVPYVLSSGQLPSPGTCRAYGNQNQDDGTFGIDASSFTNLDAGASFSIRGPGGSVTVTQTGKNVTINPTGAFLAPGTYTLSGAGGKDVGAFSASLEYLPSPTLRTNLTSVIRNQGFTVNWTGGDPRGVVIINVFGNTAFGDGASAQCVAAGNAATFTVPNYITLAMPPGNNNGFLQVDFMNQGTFSAPGLLIGTTETKTNLGGAPLSFQ